MNWIFFAFLAALVTLTLADCPPHSDESYTPNDSSELCRKRRVCVPTAAHRGQPGMYNWCLNNCRMFPFHCPRDRCYCP